MLRRMVAPMQLPGVDQATNAAPLDPKHWLRSLETQFTDVTLYGETLFVLLVSVLLGGVLAYHPSLRRKVSSRAELEQPKTVVLYALVGALVGHIVALNSAMALVIFGIGGLMRFRTIVGEAKDTGRVILAAIVGICCGLQSYLIATLATSFGWLIVWYLERQVIGSVQILGLATDRMHRASEGYRALLSGEGCKVVSERRNPKKGEIEMVFVAPGALDQDVLKTRAEQLDEAHRGVAAWEIV